MELSRVFNEPVMLASAVRAVILAVASFGFPMTTEQIATTMFAVEALLAVLTRAVVVPVKLVEERIEAGVSPTKNP